MNVTSASLRFTVPQAPPSGGLLAAESVRSPAAGRGRSAAEEFSSILAIRGERNHRADDELRSDPGPASRNGRQARPDSTEDAAAKDRRTESPLEQRRKTTRQNHSHKSSGVTADTHAAARSETEATGAGDNESDLDAVGSSAAASDIGSLRLPGGTFATSNSHRGMAGSSATGSDSASLVAESHVPADGSPVAAQTGLPAGANAPMAPETIDATALPHLAAGLAQAAAIDGMSGKANGIATPPAAEVGDTADGVAMAMNQQSSPAEPPSSVSAQGRVTAADPEEPPGQGAGESRATAAIARGQEIAGEAQRGAVSSLAHRAMSGGDGDPNAPAIAASDQMRGNAFGRGTESAKSAGEPEHHTDATGPDAGGSVSGDTRDDNSRRGPLGLTSRSAAQPTWSQQSFQGASATDAFRRLPGRGAARDTTLESAHHEPGAANTNVAARQPVVNSTQPGWTSPFGPAVTSSSATGVPAMEITRQVAEHVVSARHETTRDGQTRIEIQLDPPELGVVSIEMIHRHHQLTARVLAAEPATLQALEQNLPSLLEQLHQAGIALDDFQTGQHTSHQQSDQGRQREAPSPLRMPPSNRWQAATPTRANNPHARLDIHV